MMQRYTTLPNSKEKEPIHYDVERLDERRWRVTLPDGTSHEVDLYSPEQGRTHLLFTNTGEAYDLGVRPGDADQEHVVDFEDQERHHIVVLNERQRRMMEASGGKKRGGGPDLKSPMAGKVITVEVSVGQKVAEGDRVLIVEAMKMENDLKAHLDGTVVAVGVEPGQTVDVGDLLLTIEADDE